MASSPDFCGAGRKEPAGRVSFGSRARSFVGETGKPNGKNRGWFGQSDLKTDIPQSKQSVAKQNTSTQAQVSSKRGKLQRCCRGEQISQSSSPEAPLRHAPNSVKPVIAASLKQQCAASYSSHPVTSTPGVHSACGSPNADPFYPPSTYQRSLSGGECFLRGPLINRGKVKKSGANM